MIHNIICSELRIESAVELSIENSEILAQWNQIKPVYGIIHLNKTSKNSPQTG